MGDVAAHGIFIAAETFAGQARYYGTISAGSEDLPDLA